MTLTYPFSERYVLAIFLQKYNSGSASRLLEGMELASQMIAGSNSSTSLAYIPQVIDDFDFLSGGECFNKKLSGVVGENPLTGERYLKYLENKGLNNSKEYKLAKEAIAQYEKYRAIDDGYWILREEMMFRNLKRALYLFEGNSVVGIYGNIHIKSDNLGIVSNMANRLSDFYGAAVHRKDLTKKGNDPDDFVDIAHRFVEKQGKIG